MQTSSTMRVGGLSGLDTDSMVQQLMKAHRASFDKMVQKRDKLIWQSEAYRQWNSDIFTFRTKTLVDMQLSKTYGTFTASSSKSDAVSATPTADAIAGTYKLQVNNIAESATFKGVTQVFDPSKLLQEQTTRLGSAIQGESKITVKVYSDTSNEPKTAVVTIKGSDKIGDVVDAFNNAKDEKGKNIGLQAMYDTNLHQFVLKTKATGATTRIELIPPTGGTDGDPAVLAKLGLGAQKVFSKNASGSNPPEFTGTLGSGEAVTNTSTALGITSSLTIKVFDAATNKYKYGSIFVNASDTIDTITQKLNNLTDANGYGLSLSASHNGSNQFTLKGPSTASKVELVASDSNLLKKMGISTSTDGFETKYVASGQDANIKFNGVEKSVSSNTVSFYGVNYTLKSPTFKSDGVTLEESTITISRDIEAEVKNIKDFVEKYNEMLDKLNKAISEPVYKDYQPLTEEEKKALSEKQIEQWEQKAKSGLLRRDSILSNLTDRIRSEMASLVDNGSDYNSLASIGIKSNDYSDKGKLTIDEAKLKEAIEKDPEGVRKLFSQSPDQLPNDATEEQKRAAERQKGVIIRLSERFGEAFKLLTEKAGVTGSPNADKSIIGELLDQENKRISREEQRLIDRENNYYKRFAAMESAINKYNSQSAWLAQQFSGR